MRIRSAALAALFALVSGFAAFAQDSPVKPAPTGIEGIWEGPLKVGPVELRLAFKVKKEDDGKFAAMMVSIDHGAQGVRCDKVEFADRKLSVTLPKIKAEFAGEMAADAQSIKGEYKQSGATFPLELKRVGKASSLNRPQHPKKPYPYKTEEVEFENPTAGNIKLAGTLTLPKGDGPFPAVVLVSGSGPQDRDETIFGHKPFLVLADHLTQKGIAVLRYDDRGVGKSGGNYKDATSADFATDAYAAVTFLKGRKEIDPKRIGIAGHSEGGMIAPMIAADHPDDVAFIVLLAGTGIPGDELLVTQVEALTRASGASAEKVAFVVRLQKTLMAAAKTGKTKDERKAAILAAAKELEAGMTDAEKKMFAEDKLDERTEEVMAARLVEPWMAFFLDFDPKSALKRVKCPVLAVNGELDLQVIPGPNLAGITSALKDGGNDRVTVKRFPGLNHLFQHTKTGLLSEYGQIEETFAPEALEFIADWVAKAK
jgi:uncharacterized protein